MREGPRTRPNRFEGERQSLAVMSGEGTAHVTPPESPLGARAVVAIVGAAVLAGVGLASLAYWMITGSWLYFAGVVPLALGAVLLFSRLTGPDRA
jgi:hypothetical protein